MFLRHVPFLKTVLLYAFTAFGGPQGHIGMMMRTFVQKRHDVTEEELLEYNAFCQMLPGPSSTQTVMLIALKRGGVPLALVALLIWIFPAAFIMALLSFVVHYFNVKEIQTNLFAYMQPMSVGFIAFAATRMLQNNVKHIATWLIMLGSLVLTVGVRSPWLFPALLIASGTISNFSNRRIPAAQTKPKPIQWVNLWLFALLFVVAGVVSQVALTHKWEYGRAFNLFENFYRFGAIVFGGGQVLIPMMLFQFTSLPMYKGRAPLVTSEELLTGYGVVQAMPGPVFSICAYVGGLVMSEYGPAWQALGCLIATIAVFLPSTLLLFFLFPVYQHLRQHVIIYRALEGINAAIVGIIWGSGFVLFQSIPQRTPKEFFANVVVAVITYCMLFFTRVPAPLIVLGWLLLGLTMS